MLNRRSLTGKNALTLSVDGIWWRKGSQQATLQDFQEHPNCAKMTQLARKIELPKL